MASPEKSGSLWIALIASGVAIGLYTAFVLQNLWNWFVVPALHASEISYWAACGVFLLVNVLRRPGEATFADDHRWEVFSQLLDACVPEERRQTIAEALKGLQEQLPYKAAMECAGQFFGVTVTLVIGWVLHSLFQPML